MFAVGATGFGIAFFVAAYIFECFNRGFNGGALVAGDLYTSFNLAGNNPMYIDRADGEPLQVGYVITAKTGFEDRDNYRYTDQYIDLWVTVYAVTVPNFEGV